MKTKNKYLFYITYKQGVKASAASKPVLDTSKTLQKLGYLNCSLTFENDTKNLKFYYTVLSAFARFFFQIKNNSIVATQFPITTVNYLFIYFIRFAHYRNIKFITIIHDLNTLRQQGSKEEVKKELSILSAYDGIVVQNKVMEQWLRGNGLRKEVETVALNFFDYLSEFPHLQQRGSNLQKRELAFAGHLTKASFIYSLNGIKNWKFNIYGEKFDINRNKSNDTIWKGEFPPDEIVSYLEGTFGLIWDGSDPESIYTNNFGNYIRYNNPFKFSLYLAAGLPVVAPKDAAIAEIIEKNGLGVTVDRLSELDTLEISDDEYEKMRQSVLQVQKGIVNGEFVKKAFLELEKLLEMNV